MLKVFLENGEAEVNFNKMTIRYGQLFTDIVYDAENKKFYYWDLRARCRMPFSYSDNLALDNVFKEWRHDSMFSYKPTKRECSCTGFILLHYGCKCK